jgi:hypothetical protein
VIILLLRRHRQKVEQVEEKEQVKVQNEKLNKKKTEKVKKDVGSSQG